MAQVPQQPNVDSQRAAMKKLSFLVGRWSGEARIFRVPTQPVELIQTEEAQYKLDGLILVTEGVGRSKSDGKAMLQGFGIVSYDDVVGTYRLRAFNDGRWLETEVKLLDGGNGFTWGFTLGDIRTSSVMRINEKGEWTERTELTIGSQPARKFMEVRVRREK